MKYVARTKGGDIMASDALTTATEITVAVVSNQYGLPPKVTVTGQSAGEYAGEVFKAVIKKIVEGINEANKIK